MSRETDVIEDIEEELQHVANKANRLGMTTATFVGVLTMFAHEVSYRAAVEPLQESEG